MRFRRCCGVLLSVVTVAAVLPLGPASAADYRDAIDITFPTTAPAWFSNDYTAWRSGGRRHMATDIFAKAGSRVVAAHGGRVIWRPDYEYPGSGYALWIRDRRGRTFAYYHLGRAGGPLRRAVAPGITVGDHVRRGQFIGWLGNSGNAVGTSPHLHFEIQDRHVRDIYGVARRNPYFSLLRAQGRPGATASRSSSRATVLQQGSRGPAVVAWQKGLNRAIGAGLTADGAFGPATRAATIAFQRSAGLSGAGLGIVGPRSRAAMQRRLQRRTTAAPAGRSLHLGSSGPAVVSWQRRLNRVTHAGLTADGAFGPATRAATIAFQRSAGLGPQGLGIVGPRTRAAMARRLRNSSPAPAAVTGTLLRYGSRGAAVARWQRQLNRATHAGLTADGAFGPATRAATIRFQRSAGLGPQGLGIVGPRTRAAMARRLR